MSRALILDLSRRISELERDVARLRYPAGVLMGLQASQQALAKQLDKLDRATADDRQLAIEEPAAPGPPEAPQLATVLARFRAHLAAAGHGGQAHFAREAGLPQSTLSKFNLRGEIGERQLARLAAALDQAETEVRQ
jgi:hypothetical protein